MEQLSQERVSYNPYNTEHPVKKLMTLKFDDFVLVAPGLIKMEPDLISK